MSSLPTSARGFAKGFIIPSKSERKRAAVIIKKICAAPFVLIDRLFGFGL